MATYVRVKDADLDNMDESACVLIKVQELKEMRARENKMVSLMEELKTAVGRVEGKADKANTMLSTLNSAHVKLQRIEAAKGNENDSDAGRQSADAQRSRTNERSPLSSSSATSTQLDEGITDEHPSTSAAASIHLSIPLPRMSPRKNLPEDDSDGDSVSESGSQVLPFKRWNKYVDDSDEQMEDVPDSGKKADADGRSKQQMQTPPPQKRPRRKPPVDYTQNFVYPGDIADELVVVGDDHTGESGTTNRATDKRSGIQLQKNNDVNDNDGDAPVADTSVAKSKTGKKNHSSATTTPKATNSSNTSIGNQGNRESVHNRSQPKTSARDTNSPKVKTPRVGSPQTIKRHKLPSKGDPVKHQTFVSDGAVVWWESVPKGGLKLNKKKYRKKMHDFIASIWSEGSSVEDLCENPQNPSNQFQNVFSSLLSYAVYEEIGTVNTEGIIYMKGTYNFNNDDRTMAEFIHDLPQPASSVTKLCCELMFFADVSEKEQFAVVRKAVEDLRDTMTCHPEIK